MWFKLHYFGSVWIVSLGYWYTKFKGLGRGMGRSSPPVKMAKIAGLISYLYVINYSNLKLMGSETPTNLEIESQEVPKAIFKAFLGDLESKDISNEVISNLNDVLMSDQPITESKVKIALFVNSKL